MIRIVQFPADTIRLHDPNTQRPITASHIALDGSKPVAYVWGPDEQCDYWSVSRADDNGNPGRMFELDADTKEEVEVFVSEVVERNKKRHRVRINDSVTTLAYNWAENKSYFDMSRTKPKSVARGMNDLAPGAGVSILLRVPSQEGPERLKSRF